MWELYIIPCTWQSLLPCQWLHMLIMWQICHWDARYQSISNRWKDQNEKPPRHGPKGGKQKHTHTVDLGDDYKLQCVEVHVIAIDVHPHHSAWLAKKPGDDHAMPSALSPLVAQNSQSATKVPLSACPTEPLVTRNTSSSLQSTLDALTEAWATVTIPAEIGPNHCGSLWCKIWHWCKW